ncbi:MAG: N-6 DNA methylase [Bacteroidales bacterium]|jgi:hypothetical protein|nr:N-6 DNA methylase [Bacteroidales bacterium]
MTKTIAELRKKWAENSEGYKIKEVGGGVHSFIADVFESSEVFGLTKTSLNTGKFNTFVHDTESNKEGRPDFILFLSQDAVIPVESKCFTRIEEGVNQLFRYQVGLDKQFGILTDGYTWRFYRGPRYQTWTQERIFANPKEFLTFWKDYLKPENYYVELFNPSGQMNLPLEDSRLDLNDPENLKVFFEDTTELIRKFKTKMIAIGVWDGMFERMNAEKVAVETSYAYLIQFILYKVLVDNQYGEFADQYGQMLRRIAKAIKDEDFYELVITDIKHIAEYISKNIYVPFKKEQESITEKLADKLGTNLSNEDIAPWLHIISFINKYNFFELKNEIFGFIYENFLKELYGDKNKGQYFTDRAVVNFMLKELGYTEAGIKKRNGKDLSIIDPSCGAGTFLYSAVDNIISALNVGPMADTELMAQRIEKIISDNIFGLDIEEFPLYLAEMSILMRMLPLIVNDKFKNPIDGKFKIFKTRDSISEFLDVGIGAEPYRDLSLFDKHLEVAKLDYPSFMRDNEDMRDMLLSLQGGKNVRERFDFVVGNPPYVGLNKCYKENVPFAVKMRDKNPDGTKNPDKTLYMNNIYGVNLHSVPGHAKKGRPNPNLYAFFFAMGLAMLKDGGKICYIIPQTILVDNDYDTLRYHLAKFATIEKIITFGGKLFVGRGLKQDRPVPTSSLIFVCKNARPAQNHRVKIVNYEPYSDDNGIDISAYLSGRSKQITELFQNELLERIDSWNFIKQNARTAKFLNEYKDHSDDIAAYYDHIVARDKFGHSFWFDGGYSIDERLIKSDGGDYMYPRADDAYYTIRTARGFWDNIRDGDSKTRIVLRQGNQGFNLLDSRYKVLWRYANTKRFFFTDKPVIWARNQFNAIGSDDKKETLYIFALLNSPVSETIILNSLKLVNEDTLTIAVGLKNIKNFIRIPRINERNQFIKDEIIAQADKMLALENVCLRDIVNLNGVQAQRFDSISVMGQALMLTASDKSAQIDLGNKQTGDLVRKSISEYYGNNNGNLQLIDITLSDLKSMPVINFEKQSQIKDYVDDLVFALYFNVLLTTKDASFDNRDLIKTKCQQNEFYEYVKNGNYTQ